ncbi:GNAT family N-acetyltransferase [Terriglobus sp. ADX1]|uniref:GNAT family N-acetyltransferase n=1 Tax=Terriglobus sp. ADX1 TaxID=2794063 RepID=UPI002FE69827
MNRRGCAIGAASLLSGQMQLDYIHTTEHPVCRVPARYYRMMNAAGEHIGNINLRLDTTEAITRYAGHIGYEVFPEHRGYRYAARAVRSLIPVAREHGIGTLWITCDPENTASRRTLELAGAEYVETVNVLYNHAIFLAGHPRKCRYRLATSPETDAPQIPSEETL